MDTQNKQDVAALENQSKPNLWNPNAAANWSLLFTPLLGAWLHAKNWEKLKEPEAAKKSMLWVYAGVVFLLVLPFLPEDIGYSPGLIFILAWYFTSGKKQVKFIKEKAIEYQKKSWNKPLLFGVIGLVVYSLYCFGMSPADDNPLDMVKNGVLGEHKSLTVGEAFDKYSRFKSTSWESFETQNGRQVVQFNGSLEIPQALRNSGAAKATLVIQFVVNKDDTFELYAVQLDAVQKGKKVSQNMSPLADNIIAKIYANEPFF